MAALDPLGIESAFVRITPVVRRTAGARACSIRTTAVLFAFGSLLTLVDALMTHALLRHDG